METSTNGSGPVAANLREAMQVAGVDITELAFHSGVTYRTVQRWLAGTSEPRGFAVKKLISDALGKENVGWLYEEIAA